MASRGGHPTVRLEQLRQRREWFEKHLQRMFEMGKEYASEEG